MADECGDNISFHHAEIYVNEHGTFIEDTNSTNGTFVDGERISPRRPRAIRSSSSVQLGSAPALRLTVSADHMK
jgi:pSer/pThr/pTyr-binding forkhead associated (FHA) protein